MAIKIFRPVIKGTVSQWTPKTEAAENAFKELARALTDPENGTLGITEAEAIAQNIHSTATGQVTQVRSAELGLAAGELVTSVTLHVLMKNSAATKSIQVALGAEQLESPVGQNIEPEGTGVKWITPFSPWTKVECEKLVATGRLTSSLKAMRAAEQFVYDLYWKVVTAAPPTSKPFAMMV